MTKRTGKVIEAVLSDGETETVLPKIAPMVQSQRVSSSHHSSVRWRQTYNPAHAEGWRCLTSATAGFRWISISLGTSGKRGEWFRVCQDIAIDRRSGSKVIPWLLKCSSLD